jgi:hypothetical protein
LNKLAHRRKLLVMSVWLTVRTFIAIFLTAIGIGLMFMRTEDMRILIGAVLIALGLTFLCKLALAARERHP